MLTLLTLLLCVAAGLAYRTTISSPKVVKVSIFYETECPDSKKFIVNELWKEWSQVQEAVTLDLVPYGKANHTRVNDKWELSFSHGSTEHIHSKLHACIIKKLKPHQNKVLKAIRCLMSKTDQVAALPECLAEIHLKADANKFIDCMNSKDADNLLVRFGDQTHKIIKNLDYLPKIVFNNKYKQTNQDEASKNFLRVVCHYIPDHCKKKLDLLKL